jgi:hypothetical protein
MDWVKFDATLARDGSCDPVDKALYAAIASFVDCDTRESPDTTDVDPDRLPGDIPTRKRLAECIGKSVDTVDRATKRLEARGLLRVHRQADPDNSRRMLPSEYELLDHHIWDERAAERALRRRARTEAVAAVPNDGGGRTGAATPGRIHAATPGRTGAAVKGREVKEEREPETAPSARSAADARRAPTGSRGRATGGEAASGKTRRRLTRAEYDAVRAVLSLLPDDLAGALPTKTPPNLSTAVVEALALGAPYERTPAQLVEYRVLPRWNRYWASRFYAGEMARADGQVSVVGPLLAMLKARPECGDISCEDRVNIHTGQPCASCAVRREERRREHRAAPGDVPAPRQENPPVPDAAPVADDGRPHGKCAACSVPMFVEGPAVDDGLCRECREDQAASVGAAFSQVAPNPGRPGFGEAG